MVAQDTGSAIRGAARADIYFGHGEDIPHIAGRIKQFGKFVMLVPKDVTVHGDSHGRSRCRSRGRAKSASRGDGQAKDAPLPEPAIASRAQARLIMP